MGPEKKSFFWQCLHLRGCLNFSRGLFVRFLDILGGLHHEIVFFSSVCLHFCFLLHFLDRVLILSCLYFFVISTWLSSISAMQRATTPKLR